MKPEGYMTSGVRDLRGGENRDKRQGVRVKWELQDCRTRGQLGY